MNYPRPSSARLGTITSTALVPLALACLGVIASGCGAAGVAVHVGAPKAAESGSLGAWDVLACSTLEGIPVIPRDGLRYVLVRGDDGLALLEQAPGAASAMVTEQWVDDDGTHFYASEGAEAWELVIRSASERGIRRVYRRTDGDARPSGEITAVCPMVVSAL